ncbi:acyltransferase [Arthrobacter sp. S39]|uniref:acyltransferase family protein n=1 Tax=Arthrobacter sp. S39 TaxID=2509720 RepID=UPI001036FE2B|nr:acyltransferase [Arthrobacter sp. S39]TAP45413.1 acyltransferase [Arthrobacter sp. S39]
MGDSNETRTTARYTSLDGLRGLAALVVLIHHCFLVSPQLSAAVDSNGTGPFEPWVWWTTFTPLHLVWAGQEAVYVFFILSGFVLTLPFVQASRPNWAAYYPKRIVRIYLPVWASLLFALLMAWTVPRVASAEFSSWLNLHDETPNAVADAFLLRGAGALNSPLWSLQWEILFSLILPLYLIAALRIRRAWIPGLAGLLVLIAVGNMMYTALPVYLPMFGIGVLLAVRRDVVKGWGSKLGAWAWMGLLTASLVLLCSRWLFVQLPVVISMASLGGVILIFAFIAWQPTIALGNNSLVRWLGVRSFSLYLIHEPIVVSVAFSLHETNPIQIALVAVPFSLLAAEVFFRLVEKPSHRLSRFIGRNIAGRGRRRDEASIA